MSVDAMWSLRTDAAGRPNIFISGGVVVLHDGRVFGGDGAIAYAGTFVMTSADDIAADVRVWTWNRGRPDADNVFGLPWPLDVTVRLEARLVGGRIEGTLRLPGSDGTPLRARLDRIAPIP